MADLIGLVTLLKTSAGGRATTAYSGFTPTVHLPSGTAAFALQFMSDDSLKPGESDAAMIEVDTPQHCAALQVGQTLEIFDHERPVGTVQILENTWSEREKIRKARILTLTPVLMVADVERAAAFYQKLGFAISSRHEADGALARAHLQLHDMVMILTRQTEVVEPAGRLSIQMTTDDPATLRRMLTDAGLKPSALRDTPDGPQFELLDLDGYRLIFKL
jgi:hypothetical protein